MIKCFIVPMVELPYGRNNPQRPKYCDDLTWSGVPLFKSNAYLVKVKGTAEELQTLQSQVGVIDFPNIDTDRLTDMPKARKDKNRLIWSRLDLKENETLTNKQFVNLCANSEVMHGWDKDKVFIGD